MTHSQALAFCRTHEVGTKQTIPSYAAFYETCSRADPPSTTIGMMPILQAPADDNNTVSTVLSHFQAITSKLGQKHTIIAGDQPLYSRTKELLWACPEKYKNVIVMMGDLHISFNFLKAIGQHLDSSGLCDIWVESGVFAQNSTAAILEGKSYYRAVRGHTLTYDALFRLKWKEFVTWLTDRNHRVQNLKEHQSALYQVFEEIKRVAIAKMCTIRLKK